MNLCLVDFFLNRDSCKVINGTETRSWAVNLPAPIRAHALWFVVRNAIPRSSSLSSAFGWYAFLWTRINRLDLTDYWSVQLETVMSIVDPCSLRWWRKPASPSTLFRRYLLVSTPTIDDSGISHWWLSFMRHDCWMYCRIAATLYWLDKLQLVVLSHTHPSPRRS